jgi:hypothetical protein
MRRDTLSGQARPMDITPLTTRTPDPAETPDLTSSADGAAAPDPATATPRAVLAGSALLAGLLPLVGNGLYAGMSGDGEQILADAQEGPSGVAQLAHTLELGGFVALCVLLASLAALLLRRSPVAGLTTAVAGAAMVAVKVASVTPTMALSAEAEALDATSAQLAVAVNDAGFVACGLLLGVALAAAGLGALRSAVLPRWLGWWAAVAGIGAAVAGAHGIVAPGSYVPVPFLLLLLWMMALGVATALGSVGRSAGR